MSQGSREGQVWKISLTEVDEMIGLVVEDDGECATMLVLLSTGVFRAPSGTLSRDEWRDKPDNSWWTRVS